MVTAYLGLGSNLGDREANLARALRFLSRRLQIEQVSSIYETEPVGYLEQPRFLNAACRISTRLKPRELLGLVKEVEGTMGRVPSFPNAPRPIDIDILLYGGQVVETPDLTIPHPRLAERAFVLVPLAEIAHDLVHPVSGQTVASLLAKVGGVGGVRIWEGRKVKIRQFTMDDYDRVWQLWQACRLPLGQCDSQAELQKKLERDPELFLVAEVNQAILGVVMGAWDGRTGWVYNHCVDPRCRRTGIGSELMTELERSLTEKGALQIRLLVTRDNLDAQDFYEARGYKVEENGLVMSKTAASR